MATTNIFRGALGLNNKSEPHRLRYAENGFCELAQAVNVVIDDAGAVKRRMGTEPVMEGAAARSIWADGDYCFYVSGGNLYRLFASGSTALVYAGCGDEVMSYAMFGGTVYCSNGTFRAKLKDLDISSWDFIEPGRYRSDSRVLGMPDNFSMIEPHCGRMYVADAHVLYESEPSMPCCFDTSMAVVFEDEITAMLSVGSGIYVSTASQTYFLRGTSIRDFVKIRSHSNPIVSGTACPIFGSDVGDGSIVRGEAAIWVSQDGVCIGDADGAVTNMTGRKMALDTITSGSACVLDGYYFFSLEVE